MAFLSRVLMWSDCRMYTLFSKSLPLDVASRVWDVFCRDGEEFLFRTALGLFSLSPPHCSDSYFIVVGFCVAFNPLTPTVATWVKLYSILCQTGLSSFVIFDIRALWRSWLSVRVPGCQKLQMTTSRAGTGCVTCEPMWQQWALKG